MIRTLLWKEYRELRTTALALTVFAVGLLFSLKSIDIASAPELSTYASVIVCMVWMAGLVAGAQPFAGEVETRTQDWLDSLPAARRQVGRTKTVAVLMYTLIHAALLFALGVAMAWFEPQYLHVTTLAMIAYGLSGLGCGLYGSALARSPLRAIGWALIVQTMVLEMSGICAAVLAVLLHRPNDSTLLIYAALICSPLPLVLALHRYSRLDRRRGKIRRQTPDPSGAGWWPLLWLSWRQMRLAFWTLTIVGLVVAIALQMMHAESLWPAIGLVFGIVAGVGTFSADRPGDAYRFLGDHRVPFGRLWLVKSAMGIAVLLVPVSTHFIVGLITVGAQAWDKASRTSGFPHMLSDHFWSAILPSYMLLGPLYGFALGQVLGMLCRKSAIAVVLAVMLGFGVLVVWWPSVIIGGLHVWQWIIPPVLLLAATRWVVRPWVSGRLGTWRPVSLLASTAALGVLGTFGGLWYRVAEVPEPNDPFDVAAFRKSLPSPEHNESGRRLAALFRKYPDPFHLPVGVPTDASELNRIVAIQGRATEAIGKQAWPADDAELNRLLDAAFTNPWFGELRDIVSMPLGMVPNGEWPSYGGYWLQAAAQVGYLLDFRALQLAHRGEVVEAVDMAFIALDLSRHLRSKAPGVAYHTGSQIEQRTLELLPVLVEAAGDRADLIEKALARLIAHDRAVPMFADTMRIEYLQAKEYAMASPTLSTQGWPIDEYLVRMALQTPWEHWRTHGILATAYAGYFRTCELPFAEAKGRMDAAGRLTWPFTAWIAPTNDQAHAERASAVMRHLLAHSLWKSADSMFHLFGREVADRVHRRAAQLQLALALFLLRHDKPAAALSDLVPEIMAELPRDPYNDESFHYRVSQGEKMKRWRYTTNYDWGYRTIAAGQGVLWSVGPNLEDNQGLVEGPAGWWWQSRERYDIIFFVPIVKKP